MRIRPWMLPCGVFLCVIVIFGMVKARKCFSPQNQVPTVTRVCRHHDLPRREKGTPISPESIRPLATQPLFVLGKAQQGVAYETADGQYVLKMFKKALRNSHKKPLEQAIFGAIIAKKYIPAETGLIACSLGPEETTLPVITIMNPKGKVSKIELQDVPFIFQHKAQPFKKTILTLVVEKKIEEAVARIKSVFTMLRTCREKGVLNGDRIAFRSEHIGFVGTRAILTETGMLCQTNDQAKLTFSTLNQLKPMQVWIEKACPELLPAYKAELERYMILPQ